MNSSVTAYTASSRGSVSGPSKCRSSSERRRPVLDRGREREQRHRDRREAERDRERRRRGRRGKQRRDDHRAERERELDQHAVDRERHHARSLVVEAMAPHRAREHADRRQERAGERREGDHHRRARGRAVARRARQPAPTGRRGPSRRAPAPARADRRCVPGTARSQPDAPRHAPTAAPAVAKLPVSDLTCSRSDSDSMPTRHARDQRGHEQRRDVGMPEKRAIARESARQHRLGNALVESQ